MEAPSTASSAASSVDGRSSGGNTDYLNLGMFSSGPSDLLEGGFSSLNNNNNNTNFGNELTGGTTSFDLSDFPTLGGSGLAALRQQQQQQQQIMAHQQMMQGQGKYRLAMTGNGNFNMASEDFPALSTGSAPNSGVVGPSNGSLLPSSIGRNQSSGLAMYKPEMDGLQLDGASGLLGNTGLGGLGALRGLQQPGSTQHPPMNRSAPSAGAIGSAASVVAGGSALSGDYGLLGLLGVFDITGIEFRINRADLFYFFRTLVRWSTRERTSFSGTFEMEFLCSLVSQLVAHDSFYNNISCHPAITCKHRH